MMLKRGAESDRCNEEKERKRTTAMHGHSDITKIERRVQRFIMKERERDREKSHKIDKLSDIEDIQILTNYS